MIPTLGRPFAEIVADLNAALAAAGIEFGEYEFSDLTRYPQPGERTGAIWPDDVRRVAVYAARGASEGHYVHVELIHLDGSRRLVFLAKTYGLDSGYAIAHAAARRLDV